MIRNKYDYLRKRYNVPARHNGRVKLDGRLGSIRGVWGCQLLVMLDGESWSRCVMPDDPDLEYTVGRSPTSKLVDSLAGMPAGEVKHG